jgi:hypothetical protein
MQLWAAKGECNARLRPHGTGRRQRSSLPASLGGRLIPKVRQETDDRKEPSCTNPESDWRAVHGANLNWGRG